MVVRALRSRGHATVNDLAGEVGVKPVTVRHHLTSLHAEGLVEIEEERHGVGRPVHVYHLTHKAERLFPHTYHMLIDRLLDEIKETFPPDTVRQLIDSLAASMAQDIRREIAGLPDEARRDRLVEWLEEQGVAARWRQADDGLHFVKYHCPYYAVGGEHRELCRIDEALVRAAVEADVERSGCLLSGDPSCAIVLHDGAAWASTTDTQEPPQNS